MEIILFTTIETVLATMGLSYKGVDLMFQALLRIGIFQI